MLQYRVNKICIKFEMTNSHLNFIYLFISETNHATKSLS